MDTMIDSLIKALKAEYNSRNSSSHSYFSIRNTKTPTSNKAHIMTDFVPLMLRIYEIIDNANIKEINELRFGDFAGGKESGMAVGQMGQSYPLVYVTTATQPEVSRTAAGSSENESVQPPEDVVLELWVVIVVNEGDLITTQKTLMSLTDKIVKLLRKNSQLRTTERGDPLCRSSEIMTQQRHERTRGALVEGMTVRIRPQIVE